jgi:hypothetical protein
MTSTTAECVPVTGGVDTHGQTHHAAVIDGIGRQLADREFPATPAGYRHLLRWLTDMVSSNVSEWRGRVLTALGSLDISPPRA